MFRHAFLACIALALAVSVSGCRNPFQPATPELPTGLPVIENFSSPDSLLTTMANAVMKKGTSGRNAYYHALADSTGGLTPGFYAVPYPAVADAWRLTAQRDPPNPWNLPLEKLFYDYLIAVLPGFTYSFAWAHDNTQSVDILDDGAGTALYHRYYELQASSADGLTTKTIAVGYADLYMLKVNSRWYLTRWEDRVGKDQSLADPEQRSMGWRRLDSTTSQ